MIKYIYIVLSYTCVFWGAQIQASHAGEIQHDGKKICIYTQWNTVPNMVWWRIARANYFPNFIFTQHSKNHEAGGECVISQFLETHVYFQWASISYIHVHVSVIHNPCVDRLSNIFTQLFLLQNKSYGKWFIVCSSSLRKTTIILHYQRSRTSRIANILISYP